MFHEAGHILFSPFGRFMTVLGGSLTQVLVPLLCAGAFLWQTRDPFAVVPEFTFSVGYDVTRNLRVFVGYTFLYLSDAVRPSEQFDALRQSPHSSIFPIPSSDFWGQGLSFGLEFRF